MDTHRLRTLLFAILADGLALNFAFLLYVKFREAIPLMRFADQVPTLVLPMLAMTLFWFGLFWLFGLYDVAQFVSRYKQVSLVFQATTTGAIVLASLIYVDDYLYEQSSGVQVTARARFGIFFYWAILFASASSARALNATLVRKRIMRGIGRQNALIVGTGKRAQELAQDIQEHPALGLNVVGFVKERCSSDAAQVQNVVGTVDDIPALIKQNRASTVIIAVEVNRHDELLRIIGLCEGKGVSLKMLPDMYEIVSGAAQTTQIYGMPLVSLDPKLLSPIEANLKRIFDVVVSLVVLIGGLPLWLVIAFLVWLDTKAFPIYAQTRVGLHGKHFTLYKFRSMRADAESMGPKLTQKEDDRVTPLGKILRKYRIDEFPQFFNVLIGDMSIVGPRPERPYFIEQIIKQAPHYTRLHRVRPGITSWGQVKYGYAANVDEMVDRLKYDLFYIENMSFGMDMKIILATIYVVITGRGQ
ncbi:MAG: sugar transferase [Chloroherpetonaceae bacterium]|nr:sugar transferase [Chloroherpetonaceae bacterium]MDW8438277.1 sugar transferase [Chloroherpetonaceae bacterium]